MIAPFGKDRKREMTAILRVLPSNQVSFRISPKTKDSTVVKFLSTNDETFSTEGMTLNTFEVTRCLNSVELFELMSFIVPNKKNITVLYEDNTWKFGCFRAAMYAFVSDGWATWRDDMTRAFTDGSREDVETTKSIYQFLLTIKEDEQ